MSPATITTTPPDTPTTYTAWRNGHLTPGRLTLARAYTGLTQSAIAYACDTDPETVDMWERGAEYPSWETWNHLAAITEHPLEFFSRPLSGPGSLYLMPPGWDRDETTALRANYCEVAVQATTRGCPFEQLHLGFEAA